MDNTTPQIQHWKTPPGRPADFHPWEVLVRRRWQLFACLLLVCGVAFAAVLMRRPHYEATARVEVVMDSPQITGIETAAPVDRDYFTTQLKLLESRRVLDRAAQNLLADHQWSPDGENRIDDLRDRIQVRPAGGRIIDITAAGPTSDSAAALANQVAAAFSEISADARRAANERLVQRVRQEIQRFDDEIESRRNNIQLFREEHLTTGPDDRLDGARNRIAQLQQQQTQAYVRRLDLESTCRQLDDYLAGNGQIAAESFPALAADQTLREYHAKLRNLLQEENRLAQVYLPGHQSLRTVRQQLADLQQRLAQREHALASALLTQARRELDSLEEQQREIARLLTDERHNAVQLASQDEQYQAMLAELQRAEAFRAQCVNTVREFALREGVAESPVMVVDAAQVPSEPAGLRKTHQAASILLLGLLFSVGFVFAWERFVEDRSREENTNLWPNVAAAFPYWPMGTAWNAAAAAQAQAAAQPEPQAQPHQPPTPSIHTGDLQTSLRHQTSSPQAPNLLGVLGNIELGGRSQADAAFAGRCRIVMSDPACDEAETFRDLAASLLRRFGHTRQGLVVTGILPHCGKTTVACNLAILLARAGRRVLLVDANAARPALHRVYPVPADHPGLDNLLADPDSLDHALCPTSENNLTILANQNPSQTQIDDNNLRTLAANLAQRFEWVIYDAGAVQQGVVRKLLPIVGKAICVAAGQENHELNAALEQVELAGAVAVGVLQNLHPALADDLEENNSNEPATSTAGKNHP